MSQVGTAPMVSTKTARLEKRGSGLSGFVTSPPLGQSVQGGGGAAFGSSTTTSGHPHMVPRD